MTDTGKTITPSQAVPPPPVQPGGGVSFFDDPKIRAAIQVSVAPILVGTVLRWLKIESDPGLVSSLSAWTVSTIIPGIVGLTLAGRAVLRRIRAGNDPNNPAKKIDPPKLPDVTKLLK